MTRQKLEEPTRYEQMGFSVARRLANQTIASGGFVPVEFDTSVFNDNGCFNLISGIFTAPKAGRWCFSSCFLLNVTVAGNAFLVLEHSRANLKGSLVYAASVPITPGNAGVLIANVFVQMEFEGTIKPYVFVTNGGEIVVGSTTHETCLFGGHYLT